MIPKKYTVADNIRLSYIQTDKFKAEALTVSLDMPLTPENYVLSHVLCIALGRGCERLPSIADINRELDELYSSTLSFNTTTRGDNLSVCLCADMISNKFVTDGTDVLRGVLHTGADMLMRPLLRDGVFLPDTVEKVKISFLDHVKSIKNYPKLYASARRFLRLGDASFVCRHRFDAFGSTRGWRDLCAWHRFLPRWCHGAQLHANQFQLRKPRAHRRGGQTPRRRYRGTT